MIDSRLWLPGHYLAAPSCAPGASPFCAIAPSTLVAGESDLHHGLPPWTAAALAPLVPLADALSLAHARPRPNKQAFEYGWVRGVGSAAFVAGTLAAGQATSSYGLSATLWLSAAGLLTVPIAAGWVPAFPGPAASQLRQIAHRPWLTLLRQRAFVWVILIAALILGSHAMYNSFAVIRWMQAGISPAATAALWSESVAAEVVVFFFLGPRLLRALSPAGALAVAAVCGLVRWGGPR